MKITVLPYQSIFDVALKLAGDIDAVFELMKQNNIDLSKPLDVGATLILNAPSNDITNYIERNKITPATDLQVEFEPEFTWVLVDGWWNDSYPWDDYGFWNDAPENI